ncbi:MAG: Holliday junction resolvase RuvX [Anaerolineae bacterium]|nr:MAG: Holliday junction resolvase RuvX [Anaerolineae bacterium]
MGERLILAVDPGEVRIGLAISDPTGTIARPLRVIMHVSRPQNAAAIADIAAAHGADLILVGLPLDDKGEVSHQARRSLRLVEELRNATDVAIETWDESGSTQMAGTKDDMIDARAAAYILQDYLDTLAGSP